MRDEDGRVREFRSLKESALAHLFALNPECRSVAEGGLQHIDELKRKAMQLTVRIESNEIVPVQLVEPPERAG